MKQIAVLISGTGTNLKNLAEECKNNLNTQCKISLVISNHKDVKGIEIAKEYGLKTIILEEKTKPISILGKNIESYNLFSSLRIAAEEEFLNNKEALGGINFLSFIKCSSSLNPKYPIITKFIECINKNPSFIKFLEREEYDENLHKALQEHNIDYIFLAGFMRILSPSFTAKWNKKIINIHPSLLPAFGGAKAVKEALKYGVKITGCTVHFVNAGVDSGSIIAQKALHIKQNETEQELHKRIKLLEQELYPEVLKNLINNNI